MILYDFDSNALLVKNPKRIAQHEKEQHPTKKLHQPLLSYGLKPSYQKLDYKLPNTMKEYIDKQLKYQLVPPNVYRRNPAERAIRTV